MATTWMTARSPRSRPRTLPRTRTSPTMAAYVGKSQVLVARSMATSTPAMSSDGQGTVQVAEDADKQDGGDAAEVSRGPLNAPAARQAERVCQAEHTHAQRPEERWLGQVERNFGHDAGQLDQHRDQHEAEVVVVDD